MNVTLVLLIVLFAVLAIIGCPWPGPWAVNLCFPGPDNGYAVGCHCTKVQLGADSYLMMAVPLFILAANIMNYSGVTERIFLLCQGAGREHAEHWGMPT